MSVPVQSQGDVTKRVYFQRNRVVLLIEHQLGFDPPYVADEELSMGTMIISY